MTYLRNSWTGIVSAALVFIFSISASGREPDVQSAKVWFDKGMLFREARDPRSNDAFKQAAGDLDSFIDAHGNNFQDLTRAYTLRARCHNLLGNNEQAIRDLDRAAELSPDDGNIYYLRSFIHEMMGHTQLSVDDLIASARKGNEKARGELKVKGIQWQ
jgi:tetratricopeptide (TPR) repeat protein